MNWLTYANQGATRNQPLSNDLLEALSFMPELGLEMKVFSGGQPAKGSGKPRVGSTRHDHGNAADVFLYKDGQRLDWANPEQQPLFQEFVQRARANGVTGIGAGDNYMQPGSLHVGFGNDGVWGAGGKGANAAPWLREAANGSAGTRAIAADAMAAIGKQPMQRGTQTAIGGSGADTMNTPQQGLLGQIARPDEKVGGLLGAMFGNMTPDRADQLRANIGGLMGINNQGMVDGARGRMRSRSGARENDLNYNRQQQQTEQERQREAQRKAQAREYVVRNGTPQMVEAFDAGGISTADVFKMANGGGAAEYGLTPQYVTRPDGSLGMIQLSKDGTAKEVDLPEGMAIQKGVEKLDLGTSFQWYNTLTGEKIGEPIPKDNRGAARETAAGASEGKTEAERTASAPSVISEAQNMENLIDDVIGDPALDSVVGNVQGRLPAGTPFNGGQAGADVQVKIDQIGGKAFLQAFESLKGGGQITEREGIAAQAAIARMNQTQSGPEFRKSLQDLKAIARNARLRAQGQEVPEYEGGAGAETPPAAASTSSEPFDPQTPDFSAMTDEELDAYIAGGGK